MPEPDIRPPGEQEHQRRAFEIYASAAGRTYQEVAREMGVSVRTIKSWAKAHSWKRRIQERDAGIARRVADQALQSGVDERLRHQKIVHMAVVRLAKAIADGKVRMQMGDLDRLIRLQDYIDGRVESDPAGMSAQELGVFLAGIFDTWTTSELDAMWASVEAHLAKLNAESKSHLPVSLRDP